jgi:hypothetical protein
MIAVSEKTTIYVVCPPHNSTGGITSLHQLAHKLNKQGIRAFIFYQPAITAIEILPQYLAYTPQIVNAIEDEDTNILIIPEIYIDFSLDNLKKIRKIIWWLSTDNYLQKQKRRNIPSLQYIKERGFYNLIQSAYSKAFLAKNNIEASGYLSGYINLTFFATGKSATKKNAILFNPKKGFEFTSRLIAAAPQFNWVPLTNMTPAQIQAAFSSNKLYIDFGNHPGRDRFPREAAAMYCCIVTGKRGSAAFPEDMPIPDEYKFDDNTATIEEIIEKLEQCLYEYDSRIIDFTCFRESVEQEEQRMESDIKKIFKTGVPIVA